MFDFFVFRKIVSDNKTHTFLLQGQHFQGNITRLIVRPAGSNSMLSFFFNRLAPKVPDFTLQSISIRHLETDEQESTLFCPVFGSLASFKLSDQIPYINLNKKNASFDGIKQCSHY